jgi:3-oxoacyl-[acyl-carrier-protein] synthase II
VNRRVVVTGVGGLCPLGSDWKQVGEALRAGRSGVSRLDALGDYERMETRLAALLATRATELALEDAGLRDAPELHEGSRGIKATACVQFMSHTVPANLAQFFEVRGRVETIMLTGGAEEFHPIGVAVFDIMFATSKRNDAPHTTPRPFDASRDGLVVGEGAATLVLEELEHARAAARASLRRSSAPAPTATACTSRIPTRPACGA